MPRHFISSLREIAADLEIVIDLAIDVDGTGSILPLSSLLQGVALKRRFAPQTGARFE
jgi:hypothetical protein